MTAVDITTGEIVGPMDANEARVITQRIKDHAEALWALLLEAHDREAWRALGYETWNAYVTGEFAMSKQRSFQVIDQGRVIQAIRAASESTTVDLSEREARDIKPRLTEVTTEVRRRVEQEYHQHAARNDPEPPTEDRVQAIVAEVVTETRAEIAERKRDQAEVREFVQELREQLPDDFDEAAEAQRVATTHGLFKAIAALASMPDVEAVVAAIPDYQRYRFDDLPQAVAWLTHFADVWETRA